MEPGTKLNHYRILALLGEGGMGRVYRADDTRLKRQVAIKVLPAELAADPERLARLEREAQILAQLDHANVASVYGIEESDGTRFLVMQLVQGQTLGDRIAEGPIPVDSAITFALQIAEGLEAAHERGIIHRDLKPANIIVTPEGSVRILDFGLAKTAEAAGAGPAAVSELTASPTMMAPTQAGVILGTASYMSPEQARGRAVDKRTDIWAFGCVLYEMLTGRKSFGGETVTDILAAIVHKEPDLEELPVGTPWRLRELLERTLAKDAVQRLRDIGDARIVLQQALADPAVAPGARAADDAAMSRPAVSSRALAVAGVAVLAAVLLTVVAMGWLDPPEVATAVRRFALHPEIRLEVRDRAPRLSPDGSRVVFYADGQFWIRNLQETEARALEGTAEATFPFWAPDSQQIGFFSEDTLWRVPVGGGDRLAITHVGEVEGAFWAEGGNIYLALDPNLAIVPAAGGDPTVVVEIAGLGSDDDGLLLDLHEPYLLPDGRSLLYRFHAVNNSGSLMIWDGAENRVLLPGSATEQLSSPVYSPTGHIVYERRGVANPGVWAVPFDAGALAISGEPFLVAAGHSAPSLAADGSLLMLRGGISERFVVTWISRGGVVEGTLGPPAEIAPRRLAVSPDGHRVALILRSAAAFDLWALDESDVTVRLTSHPETESFPSWDPARDRIVYTREVAPEGEIWSLALDGIGSPERITEGARSAFSPDGRYMVFERFGPEGGSDLWMMDLSAGDDPRVFLRTRASEFEAAISPDGTLIAYVSDESGRPEVHLREFPDGSGRRVVSTGGGRIPQWSPDGGTLYYIEATTLVAVPVTGGRLGAPTPQLSPRMPGLAGIYINPVLGYGVSPDGERFLLPARAPEEEPPTMVLVQNWWSQFAGDR